MAENRFLDKDGLSILVTKIKTELDNVDDVLLFKGIVNDAEVLQGSAASISQISYISSKKVFVGYNKPSYYNNWGTRAKYCNEAGTPIGGKIFIDVDTYKVYTWNGGDLREVLGKDLATINRVLDSLPANILTGISATTDAESITLSFAAAGKGSKGDYGAANAKEIVLNPATPNDAGLMSAADKKKIDKAATLDEQGKVPSSQLPSFVDDVQEFQGFVENVTLTDTPPVVLSVIIGIYYDVSRKVFITKVRNGETEVYTSKMFPSFVDKPTSPTPLSGKIYVDQSTNKTYRWSGSNLVEISASLALGETENTAFAGDRGVALEGEVAGLKESVKTKADKDFVGNNLNSITRDISNIKTSAIKNIRPSYDATHVNLSQEKIEGAAVNISIDTATSSKAGAMSAADKEKLDNFIDSEGTRNRNETARVSAETGRAAAETARAKAETARADAETKRAAAETKREEDFSAKVKEVGTAVTNANTATADAEKVDATITDANVFEVTGRDGVKKSLGLVGQAEADVMKKDVDRIKESMGAYSDRPNITLAAMENNVAISADGVKVPKNGWAIAEFTAEKGNEYLFKPNVVDGSVCLFAEEISKVETRGIDYSYTYNESDGTIATATATYLGKTHVYTYTYGEGNANTPTITDEAGNVVAELPYQYQTTVGSFAPLVRLNADAELPMDGYCRFMSHFQGNNALKVVVSYKVDVADLTMKVLRDGVTASISTQLGNLTQKENETRSLAVELKRQVDTFIDKDGYIGMARMNGDASGDAETTYGTAEKIHQMGAKFRLCTVKNGKITHRCAPGRLTLGENGEEVKIDGTDGDVMLCVEDGLHLLKATKKIDGREMNIIGLGDSKSVWYGVQSKEIPAFGLTPCETVNAKILDDVRSQAHCVYNTSAIGSYSNAAKYNIFKDTYKKSGGGYCSLACSSIKSIKYAQNKNEDNLTCNPYMGLHFEFMECLISMMFSEIGSLCHTKYDMFGSGISSESMNASQFNDDAISGISGWKFITANGKVSASKWAGKVYANGQTTTSSEIASAAIGDTCYNEMLEPQRVLDAIQKAGLVGKIGSKSNIFHYDVDGNMVCTSDGSVNIDTGEGMEACKRYYIVRNVPKCEGMADGVMTAVVNSYTKFEFCDGAVLSDKTTDMTGGIAIMKRSMPVYRGWFLPFATLFRNINYGYYVARVDAEGVIDMEYDTIELKDVKPLKDFGNGSSETTGRDSNPALLEGMSKSYKIDNSTNFVGEFCIKKCNYSMGLFCMESRGGNIRTYENAYLWIRFPSNKGNDFAQVRGITIGCFSNMSVASVRSIECGSIATAPYENYAGAFAVLLNQ